MSYEIGIIFGIFCLCVIFLFIGILTLRLRKYSKEAEKELKKLRYQNYQYVMEIEKYKKEKELKNLIDSFRKEDIKFMQGKESSQLRWDEIPDARDAVVYLSKLVRPGDDSKKVEEAFKKTILELRLPVDEILTFREMINEMGFRK